jgi:hypothetical protein
MARPLIIKRPKLLVQPLDEAGDPDGAAVDVSSDVRTCTLEPDQSIDSVSTFAGTFTTTGDTTVGCSIEGLVSADSRTLWPTLVGVSVEIQIFDRPDATEYRAFPSEIPFDPSLYGGNDAESTQREWSMDLPVLGPVAWVTVTP